MRRLKIGEDVLGREGDRLGQVERLVIDEGAHQVTAIVVAGRVVPLGRFRDAGPDGLAVDLDGAALDRLPRHDEAELDPPGEHWTAPAGYRLSNFLAVAAALLGQAPYQPPVHASLALGAPAEIIAGSPAWLGPRPVGQGRVEPRQIGTVEELVTDQSGRVVGIILARRGRRYRVGIEKVLEAIGPNVHLDLNDTDLELLEPEP